MEKYDLYCSKAIAELNSIAVSVWLNTIAVMCHLNCHVGSEKKDTPRYTRACVICIVYRLCIEQSIYVTCMCDVTRSITIRNLIN